MYMLSDQDWITLMFGIAMLLTNIGARYIMLDINHKRDKILGHPYMKYIYVYCMGMIGTRNFLLAGIITTIYSAFMILTD